MARTKADREAEALYETMFKAHACNIQFGVMDLGPMTREFHAAVATGTGTDDAMRAVVAKYRKN